MMHGMYTYGMYTYGMYTYGMYTYTDRNSVGSVLILSTTTTCPGTRAGISST